MDNCFNHITRYQESELLFLFCLSLTVVTFVVDFNNSTTFWYDLISLNRQSYGWNVTIKNFRSIYNNFYGIINFRVFLIRCGRYKKVLHVKAIRFPRQASMHLSENQKYCSLVRASTIFIPLTIGRNNSNKNKSHCLNIVT